MPGVVIGMQLTGERQVELRLDKLGKDVRDGLLERIRSFTEELKTEVVAAAPHDTGKLQSEIQDRITQTDKSITGRVEITADFGKAGALEYGAHGSSEVAEHIERRTNFFGRIGAQTQVSIGAHSRTLDIAEHRYLRGPFSSRRPNIESSLQEAIQQAAN